MQRILVKIDVTKIDKSRLYEGKKGVYLDAVLFENKDGESKYGDDGFVVQSISQEARANGEKGAIIGNWRFAATQASNEPNANSEQVPF